MANNDICIIRQATLWNQWC